MPAIPPPPSLTNSTAAKKQRPPRSKRNIAPSGESANVGDAAAATGPANTARIASAVSQAGPSTSRQGTTGMRQQPSRGARDPFANLIIPDEVQRGNHGSPRAGGAPTGSIGNGNRGRGGGGGGIGRGRGRGRGGIADPGRLYDPNTGGPLNRSLFTPTRNPQSQSQPRYITPQRAPRRPVHTSGMRFAPTRIPGSGQIDPTDFDRHQADKEILGLYLGAPTVYTVAETPSKPFYTAYLDRLQQPDPRLEIYPPFLESASTFTKECYTSWQSSAPSEEEMSSISRIVWNVNEAIADKWPNLPFVVEPFGSISWRGETGGAGDLDLVLRDYERPLGYTEEFWGPGGGSNRRLPSVYNMFVVGRWLENYGYEEVQPIKHASCPIVKFKDPFSDFHIDLNVNDLGGLYNSAMINAYCKLAPYHIRPLIHVVKAWTKARDLNNPSGNKGQRTLSSYCWTLMVIIYMQSIKALPNLQDEELMEMAGRTVENIWVGYGKREGTLAEVGFADYISPEVAAELGLTTVEWKGQSFGGPSVDVGSLVQGFFAFWSTVCQGPEFSDGEENALSHAHHCFSAWKGGAMERGFPLQRVVETTDADHTTLELLQAIQKEEKAARDVTDVIDVEEQEDLAEEGLLDPVLPAAAQQAAGAEPKSNARSRPIEGFEQPFDWSKEDLVIQDPFLHDKNCAGALGNLAFQRLKLEMNRAHNLTRDGAPLAELLEWREREPSVGEKRANDVAASKQRKAEQVAARKAGARQPGLQNGAGSSRQMSTSAIRSAAVQDGVPRQSESVNAAQKQVDIQLQSLKISDTTNDGNIPVTQSVSNGNHANPGVNDQAQAANGIVEATKATDVHTEKQAQDFETVQGEIVQPRSLGSVDTVYSADSIEFCPVNPDIFVCGTYQLQKVEVESSTSTKNAEDSDTDEPSASPATRRLGRALVYEVTEGGNSFKEIQRFDGPAVLDMKWLPSDSVGWTRLAIANAEGQITLHKWDALDNTLKLDETVQVEDQSVLCLSIDWNNRLKPALSDSLITSLSNGNLAHVIPDTDGSLTVDHAWHAHDYEPWITAFDLWTPDSVWSGGDDLKLKRWDTRAPFAPTFVNKQFEGGVTTIAPNPHVEHMLAVGSYDANLRIFDARNARTPLETIPVGGGIWRTKWHPSAERHGDVLLACMHGGFKVVGLDAATNWLNDTTEESKRTWRTVAAFNEHESIAYGVDWQQHGQAVDGTTLIASCSFYDHLMHLWRA